MSQKLGGNLDFSSAIFWKVWTAALVFKSPDDKHEHYENKSDLVILDEARKMNNGTLGTDHIKGLILDASKRDHTTLAFHSQEQYNCISIGSMEFLLKS